MSKLDEIIGATKQMEAQFDINALLNTQMVLGKENDSKARSAEANDVK